MRSPSARCLPNTVTLYRFTPTQSRELGVKANPYTLLAASVPCSVQPSQPERYLDGAVFKVAEMGSGAILFRTDYSLTLNDKAVWVDGAGKSHDLYVTGSADLAGRGAAFEVSYEERFA